MKEIAASSLSFGPNRVMTQFNSTIRSLWTRPITRRSATKLLGKTNINHSCWGVVIPSRLTLARIPRLVLAGSRADDSVPYEMSVENALKLLGVSEGDSFDDILRAKKSVIASCRDDQEAIAQVEAAYDMLLMQSLTQRRAGKVVSSSIRYADVKPVSSPGMSSMPRWLQTTVKNAPISIETPPASNVGIQAGVYGALMVLTYANGASTSSAGLYAGADVPGLILATSFGASLYFLTKKNIKLGKSTIITIGGLVVGAVVGSAVENWLQVDIVPFFGVHSPAVVIWLDPYWFEAEVFKGGESDAIDVTRGSCHHDVISHTCEVGTHPIPASPLQATHNSASGYCQIFMQAQNEDDVVDFRDSF